jgi:hypothetical protein
VPSLILTVQLTAAITTLVLLATCVAGALRWEYQTSLDTGLRDGEPIQANASRRRRDSARRRFAAEPGICFYCGQMFHLPPAQQMS